MFLGQQEREGLIPAAGPGGAGRVNPTALRTPCPLHPSVVFQPWTIEKPWRVYSQQHLLIESCRLFSGFINSLPLYVWAEQGQAVMR